MARFRACSRAWSRDRDGAPRCAYLPSGVYSAAFHYVATYIMSLSTDEYDRFIVQCADHDPEFLQRTLDVQRSITEGLLTIAQHTVDDPEKQAVLDELEEHATEIGMIGSDEDDGCTCNCSCSSSSLSVIESNASEDADANASEGADADLDPTAPGKILDAAAQAAANDTDELGEPSSGSLREYREQQANASEDEAEDVDGTPASLSAWRETEDGKRAFENKEDRRPSLMDLLRVP